MTTWMKMTQDQRKTFDDNEKQNSMERKKMLLIKIRQEYQEIRKMKKQYLSFFDTEELR